MIYFPKCAGIGSFPKSQIKSLETCTEHVLNTSTAPHKDTSTPIPNLGHVLDARYVPTLEVMFQCTPQTADATRMPEAHPQPVLKTFFNELHRFGHCHHTVQHLILVVKVASIYLDPFAFDDI